MAEHPDGKRLLIALCTFHHRRALANRQHSLYRVGSLEYEYRPYKPGTPWVDPRPAEEAEDDDASEE